MHKVESQSYLHPDGTAHPIEIIDYFVGNPVARPLKFPNADIQPCEELIVQLLSEDSPHIRQKSAFRSSSGRLYEYDSIIREDIQYHGNIEKYNEIIRVPRDEAPNGDLLFEKTGLQVVVKKMPLSNLPPEDKEHVENPVQEMRAMNYYKNYSPNHQAPFISTPGGPLLYSFLVNQIECCRSPEFLYHVMEFIDGPDLIDYVNDYVEEHGKIIPENKVREIFTKIIDAVSLLHSLGVCHRDMSLENVIVKKTEEFRVVTIDFGMSLRSALHPESGNMYHYPGRGRCGKFLYMAPEIFAMNSVHHGGSADVWTAGVMLFVLLTTSFPVVYNASSVDPRYRKIISPGGLADLLRGRNISAEAIDLMGRMLRPDPHDRITVDQIRSHDWIQGIGGS